MRNQARAGSSSWRSCHNIDLYFGLTLFQAGLGIALDNGWIAALAPLALVIVHFVAVRPDEAYLTEKFGESYLRYKATVRRYL